MKITLRRRWVGFTVFFLIGLGPLPTGWAGDDFQTWQTVEIKKRLGPEWELFFMPEIRIRDDASELFYHEFRQGIRFKPSKHLQLGVNYLFARNTNTAGKHRDEQTGELDITPKTRWGAFDLSLRVRLALRTIDRSTGEQEYHMRFNPKVAYPTKFAGHQVTPYVANDLFYDYTRDAFNQNRLFLGFAVPLGEHKGVKTGLDLYYMLQSQLGAVRDDWSSNQILGAKWIAEF